MFAKSGEKESKLNTLSLLSGEVSKGERMCRARSGQELTPYNKPCLEKKPLNSLSLGQEGEKTKKSLLRKSQPRKKGGRAAVGPSTRNKVENPRKEEDVKSLAKSWPSKERGAANKVHQSQKISTQQIRREKRGKGGRGGKAEPEHPRGWKEGRDKAP